MVRVCSTIRGDRSGLTLSLIALVVKSIVPLLVWRYMCAVSPSSYDMLMNWSVVACYHVGLLTHVCYSQLNLTIAMKVGRAKREESN